MNPDHRLANAFIMYVAVAFFFTVGGLTTTQLGWLHALHLPSWMPVDDFVAAAWLVLFLCVAGSMSLFWNRAVHDKAFHYSIALYSGNALFVILWNFVFFGLHNLPGSIWVACLLVITNTVLAIRVRKVFNAAVLLVPFILWLVFAIFVTQQIIVLNP
jgi:benzodiazapine receptor